MAYTSCKSIADILFTVRLSRHITAAALCSSSETETYIHELITEIICLSSNILTGRTTREVLNTNAVDAVMPVGAMGLLWS